MSVEKVILPPAIEKPMNEAQSLMAGIYASGDKVIKQNWEDLEGFYNTLMTALVTANNETINMLRTPGILSHIVDKAATKLAINGLDSDIKQFSEELNSIRELHKGRTGPIMLAEDITKSFSIFELYMTFQTRYHSVIMPTVEMIVDQCSEAAKLISESVNKEDQLEELQDPNVISDIVVKEPSTGNVAVVTETVESQPINQ